MPRIVSRLKAKLLRSCSRHHRRWLRHFTTSEVQFVDELEKCDAESPTLALLVPNATTAYAEALICLGDELRSRYHANIVSLLHLGGPLRDEFQRLGPTFCLEVYHAECKRIPKFSRTLRLVRELLKTTQPTAALIEGVGSVHLLRTLPHLELPMISFLDDQSRLEPSDQLDTVVHYSKRVVLPTRAVYEHLSRRTCLLETKAEIVAPGLLQRDPVARQTPCVGNETRDRSNIPQDAFVVLGYGTPNAGTGFDRFATTATSTIPGESSKPIYFVWLGASNSEHSLFRQIADEDIKACRLNQRVKYIDSGEDRSAWLAAANVVYLPSRVAPSLHWMHQAMAASLPIVFHRDGESLCEVIPSEGNRAVAIGDICQASKELLGFAASPFETARAGQANHRHALRQHESEPYVNKIARILEDCAPEFRFSATHNPCKGRNRGKDSTHVLIRPPKRRVIFTSPRWEISGVNTFAETLVSGLNQRGFEASVLLTTPADVDAPPELMPHVPYRFLTYKSLDNEQRKQAIIRYLNSEGPCVFVPNHDYVASATAPHLDNNVGILGILHSDDPAHYSHGYRMGHHWDRIVCVSNTILEELLQMNPAFIHKTSVIRYGIKSPEASKREAAGKATGLSLIYTGRIVQHQKRIFDLVDVAERLVKANCKFQLTVVGDGPDQEEFAKRMRPHTQRGCVRLMGRLPPPRIAEELASHDALVLTSEFEGLPISLLEGMSHGCVPVVTDVRSGIGEVLKHQQNALVAPVGATDALAASILELSRQPDLLEKLRRNSLATLDRFRLKADHMADAYSQVIDPILAEIQTRRGPRPTSLHNCRFVERLLATSKAA